MNQPLTTPFLVENVYYIKLGAGGRWEEVSIADGIICFGYNETIKELALVGEWSELKDRMRGVWSSDEGALTRHINQVRKFYEATEKDIFITFYGRSLNWCRPTGPVERNEDGSHWRRTINGWSNRSLGGQLLSEGKLSGNLTKIQMFQGTISNVQQKDYLLRRLVDENLPQVDRAIVAEKEMISANIELMKLLTWRDFELLVDLVFTSSGWRRISEVGGTAKTVDIELQLPTTGERAFVQVKSRTNDNELLDYVDRFQKSSVHDRMFYVWHSGTITNESIAKGISLIGPERLADMVLESGLSSWLREKVS